MHVLLMSTAREQFLIPSEKLPLKLTIMEVKWQNAVH